MPDSDQIHSEALRNGMGDATVFPTAAKPQEEASYRIISYSGRDLPESYHGLVYSKWLRSLRHGNDYFKLIDAQAFYKAYGPYISMTLHRPEAIVRLAVLTDDPDVVLGFSVSRETILDYVHVLRIRLKVPTGIDVIDYRRRGIGTALMPQGITSFTHITRTWLTIWGSKFGSWKFNPFA